MKRFVCLLLALMLCVTVTSCQSADTSTPEESAEKGTSYAPLLYEVTDSDGDRIWLFGSIHVGDESMYPFPDYVTEAFDEADALAVECDILNISAETSAMMLSMFSKAMYTDGTTIRDHIDEQVYEDAKALLKEHHAYTSVFDSYHPVVWWLTLQQLAYGDYDPNYGVDMQLLKEATEEGKPIIEIESGEAQYEMLFSFSPEVQILLMEETVNGLKTPMSMLGIDMMINAWKSGNATLLETMVRSETGEYSEEEQVLYDEYNKLMMDDRDLLMADFAEQALIDGEELFICVGMAHVVGDEAMVGMLEDRGYTVTQVS